MFLTSLSFLTERILADEELKTNITETDIFVLPSGQEIEKEGKPFRYLVVVHAALWVHYEL